MSIARAFTTKRSKRDASDIPQRSLTTKGSSANHSGLVSIRDKISSPVGLISTTNMLSYNAPDIYPSPTSRSSNSASASDISDSDHKSISSASTPPSSPDTDKGTTTVPNHLSCYFNAQSAPGLSATKSTPDLKDVPKIPTRAPSHTAKRSHESLGGMVHKKSLSKTNSLSHQSSSPNMGRKDSSSGLRSSLQMFSGLYQNSSDPSKIQQTQPREAPSPPRLHSKKSSHSSMNADSRPRQGLPSNPSQKTSPMPGNPNPRSRSNQREPPHPFGNELAQVTELAEEYSGGKVAFADEESALMAQKGLYRFEAEDYMSEIAGLWGKAFGERREKRAEGMMWI